MPFPAIALFLSPWQLGHVWRPLVFGSAAEIAVAAHGKVHVATRMTLGANSKQQTTYINPISTIHFSKSLCFFGGMHHPEAIGLV